MQNTKGKPTRKKANPLLIGIIVDVSNSMRRNWKNRQGRKMPRIEVVRDALNRQFQKALLLPSLKGGRGRSIDVFCLGMGFKRPMYWSGVELKHGREDNLNTEWSKHTDTGVVCDLIALSQIIPTKKELLDLERAISKKWNQYAATLMAKADQLDDDIYEQLRVFIQGAIQESASRRLHSSIIYRIYSQVKISAFMQRNKFMQGFVTRLSRYITGWEIRIEDTSARASERYLNSILDESKKLFNQEKRTYEEFIRTTLQDFVTSQVQILITLLTLGYPAKTLLDYFDEEKIFHLARQIFQHLDSDVRRGIGLAWTLNRGSLFVATKSVRASLDSKQVRALTEKCIQKFSWNLLEDFVRQTVTNIFEETFEEEAKKKIPDWIGLAASREVTRSIKQLVNLLPDSLESTIYSDEFMFGTTPIGNTIELASLRFLDKSRKNWEKILIIISDGEFSSQKPLITAILLKRAGVRVICCYLTTKDIMSVLTNQGSYRWPDGAKAMFEMASTVDPNDRLIVEVGQKGYNIQEGVKLFYQVNQSELLEDVFEAILA